MFVSMFQVLDLWYQSLPHWYTVKYLVMFVSYVPGAGFMVPIFVSMVHSQVSCDVCFLCSRCWICGTNLYHGTTPWKILCWMWTSGTMRATWTEMSGVISRNTLRQMCCLCLLVNSLSPEEALWLQEHPISWAKKVRPSMIRKIITGLARLIRTRLIRTRLIISST